MQLMARAVVGGVISERDRLFEYTIGEFFQELSLFLSEVETKNRELENMKKNR